MPKTSPKKLLQLTLTEEDFLVLAGFLGVGNAAMSGDPTLVLIHGARMFQLMEDPAMRAAADHLRELVKLGASAFDIKVVEL